MSKGIVGLVAVVIAVIGTIGFVVAQSAAPEATANAHGQFQMDLVIDTTHLFVIETGSDGQRRKTPLDTSGTIDLVEGALARGNYNVDSFFDIMYVSNIGSSGEDGVSFKSSPTFDVFFEIDYRTSQAGTFDTEMLSMSLRASPGGGSGPQGAIDVVKEALEKSGGNVYVGHVTLIR